MRTIDAACTRTLLAGLIAFVGAWAVQAEAQTKYHLGRVATPAEVAAWNIDVAPDGKNLPAGSGTVARGREVYDAQCAACHGTKGEGGVGDRLSGGRGTLGTQKPVFTVGSYWPYATTLFDYIRRAMPLNAPQSLSNQDVYAVSGY
ncbi:MAG: cytochrome c, partial [Betaproteobacteria bacterium]